MVLVNKVVEDYAGNTYLEALDDTLPLSLLS